MLHPTLHHLRDAFRHYAATQAPDIASFCGAALNADHPEKPLPPSDLPATKLLPALTSLTCEATAPLTAAVLAAAPHIAWRQSYTTADPGFDQHYLDTYGWFNLIAPSGPFVSTDLRLSVGYWGQGLHYPRHWHEPEEIYLTLAGRATYISEGRAPIDGGPGATICHYSSQPHAAKFPDAPLLAAAFWRGNNLEAKSGLTQ
jgi:hypothetical protein